MLASLRSSLAACGHACNYTRPLCCFARCWGTLTAVDDTDLSCLLVTTAYVHGLKFCLECEVFVVAFLVLRKTAWCSVTSQPTRNSEHTAFSENAPCPECYSWFSFDLRVTCHASKLPAGMASAVASYGSSSIPEDLMYRCDCRDGRADAIKHCCQVRGIKSLKC